VLIRVTVVRAADAAHDGEGASGVLAGQEHEATRTGALACTVQQLKLLDQVWLG
jgi:hypothetical protein